MVSGPNYSGAFHFSDGADEDVEYEYDQNGNLTKDLNKNVLQIQYNLLNLPSMITFNSNRDYKFVYDATGRKLSATFGLEGSIIGPIHSLPHGSSLIDEPMAGLASPLGGGIGSHPVIGDSAYINPGHGGHWGELLIDQNYQYCGNIFYSNGNVNRIFFDGGYITISGDTPTYHYYLQDHLGNNRVVVNQNDSVEQVNHYYPFGALFGESTGGDKNRYKYNGKELDRLNGLDWYDYGARWHDAALGRWATVDPMAEKYYNISPYNYCHNNPVLLIDFNGEEDNYWLVDNNENKNIKLYHDNFFKDDPNVINIWAHGIIKEKNVSAEGFSAYIDGKEHRVTDVESFLKVLENSELWKENQGKNVKIVLHSCSTSAFAETLSKSAEFRDNNVSIIAPTLSESVFPINTRVEQNFFEEMLFGTKMKTTDFFHGVYEGIVKKANTESGKKLFVTKKGSWNMYRQGLLEKKYAWNSAPGSIGFTY